MRHDLDATSFGAGVVFAVLGALFLADGLDAVDFDIRWVAPILLIGLGVAGLATTIRTARLDR
jgi:hypothetical protein